MITAKAFAGKHYAVYGLARSGLATVEALLASGARVTAWDGKEEARAALPEGAKLADLDAVDLAQFHSLVVTPGLPLNRHPIAARAREAGVEIIGDIELFARARAELPPHKVVGITGTNGKSTTTALVHHILATAGVPSLMGGNFGLPILSRDPLPTGGVYVLELSSYQIDLTFSLDCDIAVLLNITPDHLDRYDGFEAYVASKARLFEMQNDPDHRAIIIDEDDSTRAIALRLDRLAQHSVTARSYDIDDQGFGDALSPALAGPHNRQNASAALWAVGTLFDDEAALAEGFRTYPGLPHRMERIREKDGVVFVNDSKATNATATAPALAAFPAIRWICGGQAKADHLDECAPFFKNVREAYTIGEASDLFARILAPHIKVAECGDLAHAVLRAAHDAQSGETVLLSPGCASFDQFKDYEARGDAFRTLVGAL
ncbi:UDP-N-acetylmuramoyl-L-alanine--D-glutamate ligase [Sphingomonas sp.]|uniref:UDP-N-acetylmuramoyl-L-alanine--D-glutamate ligase n=1 Tax=Sphingomonas sp. TaxID=28214 RepID=UPI0025E8AB5E|nr:UDP-N-acetylmuramoyl-L-alanine--D-glutamate ligase [Sphingomonas sp.]